MSFSEFLPDRSGRAPTRTPMDENIGERIRSLRILHQISQEQLAKQLGISYQQLQKYERGQNSVSLYRLKHICEVLNVDWSHFLDPMPELVDSQVFAPRHRTTIEMLEAFEAISNGSHRRTLINLAQALADKQ